MVAPIARNSQPTVLGGAAGPEVLAHRRVHLLLTGMNIGAEVVNMGDVCSCDRVLNGLVKPRSTGGATNADFNSLALTARDSDQHFRPDLVGIRENTIYVSQPIDRSRGLRIIFEVAAGT